MRLPIHKSSHLGDEPNAVSERKQSEIAFILRGCLRFSLPYLVFLYLFLETLPPENAGSD